MRPPRTFTDAAVKYLSEADKATLWVDAIQIKLLRPFIGALPLEEIHMGSLQGFIEKRRKDRVKNRTINAGLQTVRHILNLCAGEWIDESGMTWLQSPPKIKFLPEKDKRKPYPLSWEAQDRLFAELPPYLREMAEFAVNAGCRTGEICALRWDWEQPYELLHTSVFVLPGAATKKRDERVVILNQLAKQVIDQQRGKHPEFVFTCKGKPVAKMYGRAWRLARERAGLPDVRCHDLRHTFGRRLRAADVPEEDRKDLLGHRSGRSVTTHYSAGEIAKLIEYANRLCREARRDSDTIVFLEKKNRRAVGGIT